MRQRLSSPPQNSLCINQLTSTRLDFVALFLVSHHRTIPSLCTNALCLQGCVCNLPLVNCSLRFLITSSFESIRFLIIFLSLMTSRIKRTDIITAKKIRTIEIIQTALSHLNTCSAIPASTVVQMMTVASRINSFQFIIYIVL